MLAYESDHGVVEFCFRSTRPRYFDCEWDEIASPVPLDHKTSQDVKGSVEPVLEFDRLARARYPDAFIVFTDWAHDPANERVGAGFYVPSTVYSFGIRLPEFTSVLSIISCTSLHSSEMGGGGLLGLPGCLLTRVTWGMRRLILSTGQLHVTLFWFSV